MRNLPQLTSVVQHNCDISDARYAGEYGLCTFLLKMREFYRWENELPFSQALPKEAVGEWLKAREAQWEAIETEPFRSLPLGDGALDPLAADAANRELLPQGMVYSAGYGRFRKPVFFLGELLRVETRDGLTVLVSSCEHARELSAPPAMLLGRTIYVRIESVRRYLWEKIEEWQWRRQDNAMARALAADDFMADPERALGCITERVTECMIQHELGEARAGELLGPRWEEMIATLEHPRLEAAARAVRDLLADCLTTLPDLLRRRDEATLHFYFATYDALRRQLYPQAHEAYERFRRSGSCDALQRTAAEGAVRWLATARALLERTPAERAEALAALVEPALQ